MASSILSQIQEIKSVLMWTQLLMTRDKIQIQRFTSEISYAIRFPKKMTN